jgi:hypothetical protein
MNKATIWNTAPLQHRSFLHLEHKPVWESHFLDKSLKQLDIKLTKPLTG